MTGQSSVRWSGYGPALALLALVACQAPDRDPGADDGALARAVDGHLTALAGFGFNGVVLVSRSGAVIIDKGYGYADPSGRPVTAETVFDVASITKGFTAAAILEAERRGLLTTQTPISALLDSVPADRSGIRVSHLLTHTSGLPRNLGDDYDVVTADSLLAAALRADLDAAPGSEYRYSNAGYSVLAALLQQATGLPYDTILTRWFFRPLGMTRTGRPPPGVGPDDAVTYHAARTVHASPLDRPDTTWNLVGNGGLLSTAADLHRWIRGLIDGDILDAAARDRAFSPRVRIRSGRDYGYGWFISDTPWGPRQVWHSGGSAEGVGAELHWYPGEDVVVVVLSSGVLDGTLPAARVVRDVEDLMFGPGEVTPEVPLVRRQWDGAPAVGRWTAPDGAVIEIRVEGDSALIELPDQATTAALARFPQHGSPAGRMASYETARRVFEGMAAGDYQEFRERLWRDVPFDGERAFWGDALRQLLESGGPFSGIDFFATARDGVELEHLGLARFGESSQLIRVHERPTGQLYFFTTTGFELPTVLALRPADDDGAAAYGFRFDALLELDVSPEGALRLITRHGVVEAAPEAPGADLR